jgi:cobalt-zinc-cadmium efflux system protein
MHAHAGGHGHGAQAREQGRRALAMSLVLTAVFAIVEAAGGWLTGSLALLADAGHMTIDVLAIGLSLFASWAAGRPTSPRKTFGYYRAEILAALVNGAVLVGAAGLICWEAVQRIGSPADVDSGPMLVIALAGLLVNLAVVGTLLRHARSSLNIRAALLDGVFDALGSVGALVAGGVILVSGRAEADAVASLLIAALVLFGAWRLLRETVDVLLEGTPAHIDLSVVEEAMREVPGVSGVHDLHVWTVTSGFVSMSGHAQLDGTRDAHEVLDALTETLIHRFDISHVTIQPEPDTHATDCCEVDCEPERARDRLLALRG